MSDEISIDDDDIGLGDDDKNKVKSNQTEWYKGEKNRTDRVAIVNFNTHDVVQLRKALKAKPDMTEEQKALIIRKVREKLAEKHNKAVDQLEEVDLLDLSEARFKMAEGYFSKTPGVGYVEHPKGQLSADDLRVWGKLGEKKSYVVTLLLIYPTDREGEVEMDRLSKFQLKPWRMSPEKYEVLRKINRGLLEGGGNIAATDLHLSCTDTTYQKITVTQAGPAIYLRNDQMKRMVLAKAIPLYKKLNPFRAMSTDDLREKLGMAPAHNAGVAPGSDLGGEDFSNVLNVV